MTLSGDRYAPVTSAIGFLQAPLNTAADALRSWRARIHGKAKAKFLDGGFEKNVHRLEPLTTAILPRELIVATSNPEWTAFFDCGFHGGDQNTTVAVLSRELRTHAVFVDLVPNTIGRQEKPGRYGAVQLQIFGPESTHVLGYIRTISVLNDGGRWRFGESGAVQDFEEVGSYSKRRVTDRFTPEMLKEYCQALGLRPFDIDFYPGPSALVVNPAKPIPGGTTASIAQAQEMIGIQYNLE